VKYFVDVGGHAHEVEVDEREPAWLTIDGRRYAVSYDEADQLGQVVFLHEGKSYALSIEGDGREVGVTLAGHFYGVAIEDERERAAHLADRETGAGGGTVESSMPGVVVELLVEEGAVVERGQPLLILEAMKMQNEIVSPWAGEVTQLLVARGQAVGRGAKLVTLRAGPP